MRSGLVPETVTAGSISCSSVTLFSSVVCPTEGLAFGANPGARKAQEQEASPRIAAVGASPPCMTPFSKRIESSYPQVLSARICGKVQRCNDHLQMNRNIPVACLHGTGIAGKVATFPAGEGSDRLSPHGKRSVRKPGRPSPSCPGRPEQMRGCKARMIRKDRSIGTQPVRRGP